MNNLNAEVSRITEKMKDEIETQEDSEAIPTFNQVIFGESGNIRAEINALRRELETLHGKEIHYYRKIDSHHKALTPAIINIKRIIRKLGKFLIEPIVGEINNYHMHVLRALEHALEVLEIMSYEDKPCESNSEVMNGKKESI